MSLPWRLARGSTRWAPRSRWPAPFSVRSCRCSFGVLPLLGLGFFVGDGIEKIFVATSIIIAVSSFSWGFRYHRRFHIFVFLVSAVALISIGWLEIDELYETPIVISGTLVLAAGHFLNRRLCRLCKECADEQASASETAQRGSDALLINERGDEHEI